MASQVIEQRRSVLDQAYARNPERFVRTRPKHQYPPTAVRINPTYPDTGDIGNSTLDSDATCLKLVDTFRHKIDVVFVAAATVGWIMANANRPAEFLHSNLVIGTNIIDAARHIPGL